MLKTIFIYLFCFNSFMIAAQHLVPAVPPCPNSPNCVSTQHPKNSRKFDPLLYTQSTIEAKATLKNMLQNLLPTAQLIEETEGSLHYEMTTKIGHFTDDLSFYFYEHQKEIHFRSASIVGWHDMGANKRRMKKITKKWAKATQVSKG